MRQNIHLLLKYKVTKIFSR